MSFNRDVAEKIESHHCWAGFCKVEASDNILERWWADFATENISYSLINGTFWFLFSDTDRISQILKLLFYEQFMTEVGKARRCPKTRGGLPNFKRFATEARISPSISFMTQKRLKYISAIPILSEKRTRIFSCNSLSYDVRLSIACN